MPPLKLSNMIKHEKTRQQVTGQATEGLDLTSHQLAPILEEIEEHLLPSHAKTLSRSDLPRRPAIGCESNAIELRVPTIHFANYRELRRVNSSFTNQLSVSLGFLNPSRDCRPAKV